MVVIALALASRWAQEGARLRAPCLLLAEVTNALYKRVVRGEMDVDTAQAALAVILAFGIEIREEPGMQRRAMALAHQLKRPTTYDCQYLALAAHYQCDLWTGDERFFNAVHRAQPRVKWVGQ
jgi:predicted nucleic acid-binding protein